MVTFKDVDPISRPFDKEIYKRYEPLSATETQYQNDRSLEWQAGQLPLIVGGIKDPEYSTPYFEYTSPHYDVRNKVLDVKKVIEEMVRTRVAFPNVQLIVDKVILVRMASPDDEKVIQAYRLWLTDTEKTIQAVFKRRIHKEIVNLNIREGSIIALKEYKLATGRRINGNGDVEYLAISDFKWMGEQRRFDFLDVAHDSCGTMKKRPEDVWDSVLNPDAGHRKGFIEELEKWRVGFHHPAAGGEQYRVAHSRLDPPSTNEDTIEYLPDCDTRAADETVITHKGNPAQKATNCDVDEKPLTEDDVALQDKVESSRQVREIFDEDLIEEVLNMSDDDDEPPSPEASNRPLELSNIQAGQKRKRLSSSSLTQVRVRKVLKKEHNIFESPDAGYRIKSAAPRILGQHQGWLRRRVEETKMGQGPKDSIDLYSLTAVTHVIYDPRIDASIIKADRRIVRYDRHFPRSHHESKYLIRIALNREACEEYGMTAEGVAMMIAYNHQNVHSIFNREKYPVVRVRQIVEAGEDVTEQEAMDFAKLLMKTLLAKGPFFLDQTSKDYGQVPERIIDMSKTKPTATIFASRESPWAKKAIRDGKPLQPIDQPMKLSTLADVTGSNRTRGKVVNVLAKVYSVDDFTIKRTNMPLKRDIIITDETTYHKIPLSIFVDPFGCIPAVGSLCLFRNVVTHDFRKGALNAYPKQCEGRDWCLPFPYAVEGHHADLHQAIVRFLDDEDDRIIITTVMKDGDKFHSSLSARWPKHKRQLWKDHATEQRMKDIRTMRRWDLVNEPEICKRCDRPHEDLVFTRGVAKLERRYTEWDEDDTMDCIAHEAVSSDESDDMDYEKEEPKDIRKLPKHHVREYWGDYP